jgi:hypothetical protein
MKLAMPVQIICFRISLQSCYNLELLLFQTIISFNFSTKLRLRLLLHPCSEDNEFWFPHAFGFQLILANILV